MSCGSLELLDIFERRGDYNPTLSSLVQPAERASARRRLPGGRRVIKHAPRPGQLALMLAFALSCFAALLYLWISFGGTSPLQPQGYRFHVHVPEATQLTEQADVRISGVPVGRVVALDPGPAQHDRRDDRDARALRARAA